MSESDQSGAGRREVAYRLFAAEFDDADFSYSESDEERAPNYVITPTGARVNRLFVVGVLTEVEEVSEDVLRARVVDPTGAFVLYAGQYQPDEQAFLDSARTPMFVAVTGKARTFQPDDSDQVFTSVRPESISEVDAATRDRWTVQTAEQTIERIGHMATALSLDVRGDDLRATLDDEGVDDGLAAGIPLATDHYHTTGAYLTALRDLSADAARVVAGERDEVEPLSFGPGDGGDADLHALVDTDVEASRSAADVAGAAAASAESETSSAATTESESASGSQIADEPSAATGSTTAATDTAGTTKTNATATAETAEPTDTDTAGQASEPVGSTPGDDAGSVKPETADTTVETGAAETETVESEGVETDPIDSEPTATQSASAETADGSPTAEVDDPAAADGTAAAKADAEADDIGDFEPGEFELDEDEREEIEAEFGTEFQSGTDVADPGEADIETPDPEELAAAETPQESASTPATESPSEPDTSESAESAESAPTDSTTDDSGAEHASSEDVDLEDATVGVMAELDDGDGADRETLVDTVTERYGVGPDDVEAAIQDALMGGRCYEPDDTTVKPI